MMARQSDPAPVYGRYYGVRDRIVRTVRCAGLAARNRRDSCRKPQPPPRSTPLASAQLGFHITSQPVLLVSRKFLSEDTGTTTTSGVVGYQPLTAFSWYE
jgi:hypothetical protein